MPLDKIYFGGNRFARSYKLRDAVLQRTSLPVREDDYFSMKGALGIKTVDLLINKGIICVNPDPRVKLGYQLDIEKLQLFTSRIINRDVIKKAGFKLRDNEPFDQSCLNRAIVGRLVDFTSENFVSTYGDNHEKAVKGIDSLLKGDVEKWNKIRENMKDENATYMLKWIDLNGIDLSGLTLRGIDLRRTDLTRSNFYRANLSSARFEDSRFVESNLTLAECREGSFRDAVFIKANLTRADFTRADLMKALFRDNKYWHTNFEYAKIIGGNFSLSEQVVARIQGSNFNEALFKWYQ